MDGQILVGTPAVIEQRWFVSGELVDPGAVTLTLTDIAGTALEEDVAADGTGAAARTFTLTTAHTAQLDTLTARWTSPTYGLLTSRYEIVGELLFTEVEARAFKPRTGSSGPLADKTKYPDALIQGARTRIADDFIRILEISPYPRFKRVILSGGDALKLGLPDLYVTRIRTAEYRTAGTLDWTAFDAEALADMFVGGAGVVNREQWGRWGLGYLNIRLGYEYGLEYVPPMLKHAALLVLTAGDAMGVVGSDIDYRATSYSDGLGTIRYLTPGLGKGDVWYTLGDVNRILQDLREHVPRMA